MRSVFVDGSAETTDDALTEEVEEGFILTLGARHAWQTTPDAAHSHHRKRLLWFDLSITAVFDTDFLHGRRYFDGYS